MESNSKPRLLITGINGYIGSWVLLKALESEEYQVRGTVRDKTNEKKIATLKETLGAKFDDLELVNADLLDKKSLAEAADGCDYILHLASPYPLSSPKNEDDVIKPAVEGTTGILEAIKGKGVKRVVITSSCAAIMDHSNGSVEVDESSWPPNIDELSAYTKSKYYAEKAAWDYLDSLEPDEKFELVTINPGVVTGPLLNKGEGTSQTLITSIMTGAFPSLMRVYMPFVDVRDVAEAHIRALTCEPNKRYAMVENTYSFAEAGELLHENFGKYGYKCTHTEMWKATAWMASLFMKDADEMFKYWDIKCHVKNDNAKEGLGMKFRSIKESLLDMGHSLIKHGYVPDKISKEKK